MINDVFNPQKINGQKLKKLKGHVKLTLKDAETGEVQKVVEGDNIFTNALPDMITQCNYFGCMDYNAILPLWEKWFGGCLLYTDPFPVDEATEEPDPNDYFIKNDSVNKLIAHAGDTYTSDIRDDPNRGMPNTYLQQRSPNSITMGWQWSPTCGNGQISAISLCHKDVGNCGTGSNSNAFKTLTPVISAATASIGAWPVTDSVTARRKPAKAFLDNHWCVRAWPGNADQEFYPYLREEGMTTFCFYRAGFKDIGVNDTNLRSDDLYTVTTYQVNWQWRANSPCYWFDEENKDLWLFASKEDAQFHQNYFWGMKTHFIKDSNDKWTVESPAQYFNVYPNEDIIGNLNYGTALMHQHKLLDGGGKQDVFYLPYYDSSRRQTDPRKLVKFNFQNQADYSIVKINSDVPVAEVPYYSGMSGITTDDVLLKRNCVINDGRGYQCAAYNFATQINSSHIAALSFGNPNQILINKMILVTKFNLNDSVMKTASNTMELEYTITEVD